MAEAQALMDCGRFSDPLITSNGDHYFSAAAESQRLSQAHHWPPRRCQTQLR